jgi:hypothetical protein
MEQLKEGFVGREKNSLVLLRIFEQDLIHGAVWMPIYRPKNLVSQFLQGLGGENREVFVEIETH